MIPWPQHQEENEPELRKLQKLDIFASLRASKQPVLHKDTRRESDASSVTRKQDLVGSLEDDILALLDPTAARSGHNMTRTRSNTETSHVDRMLESMRGHYEDLSARDWSSPDFEPKQTDYAFGIADRDDPTSDKYQPPGNKDTVEDMLAMIEKHNRSCAATAHQGHVDTDHLWLLDEDTIAERLAKHFADPGEKRSTQRHKINERLAEAELNGDVDRARHYKREEKRLDGRILGEFRSSALQPLREAMQLAERAELQELMDLYDVYQANLAVVLQQHRCKPALEVVQSTDRLYHETLAHANDTLDAINEGHIPATAHILNSAHKSSRRSTTRFRRLYAADVEDAGQRQAVMERRLGDPAAGSFIAKTVLEMKDTQSTVDMGLLSVEKMEKKLEELRARLERVQDGVEVALLSNIAGGSVHDSKQSPPEEL